MQNDFDLNSSTQACVWKLTCALKSMSFGSCTRFPSSLFKKSNKLPGGTSNTHTHTHEKTQTKCMIANAKFQSQCCVFIFCFMMQLSVLICFLHQIHVPLNTHIYILQVGTYHSRTTMSTNMIYIYICLYIYEKKLVKTDDILCSHLSP